MASSHSQPTPHRPERSFSGHLVRAKLIRFRTLFRKYWWVVAFGVALGIGGASWYIASQKTVFVPTARMLVSGKVTLPESGAFAERM